MSLICVVTILLIISHNSFTVRGPDFKGKEFIVAFMENHTSKPSLEIFITTTHDNAVNVNVSSPRFSSSSLPLSFSITAGEINQIQLDSSFAMSGTGKDSKAILVTSNEEVILYGASIQQFTTEAFLSLPTDTLSMEYYVATYGNSSNLSNEILLIGIFESTVVVITLSDAISSESVTWQGMVYHRGESFQVHLDRFDTVQIQSNGDLTGSHIRSNKPIGVMSGGKCVKIGQGYCDHIVEMMMPVMTWGRVFASVPIPGRSTGDVFRFIASENNTNIVINCGYNYTTSIAKAGGFSELIIPSTSYCYIKAEKAIMVVQYVRGQSDTDLGDPSMLLVQPLGGYSSSFTFKTLEHSKGSFQNYLAILVRKQYRNGLKMDDEEMNIEFYDIFGTGFVGGYINITEGTHTIKHDSPIALFAGYLYGKTNAVSYAFPVGCNLAPINLACNQTKTVVGDGVDNDCDSLIDEEMCTAANNATDDDGDGLINEDCAIPHVEVDECDPNPCQNNGKCNGTFGAFECICTVSFTGFLCQTDSCLANKIDIVFLMDTSLSTNADDLDMQREFMKDFLKQITLSDERFRLSVIKYSDRPIVEIPFDSNLSTQEIFMRLEGIQLMNRSTNVGAALKMTRNILLNRKSTRQYVYLFTDGLLSDIMEANSEASLLQQHLDRIRRGNELLLVSYGQSIRHKTLLDIADAASIGNKNIFTLSVMDALYNVLPSMVLPECEECTCSPYSDVIFMLDSSGNMTNDVFQNQVEAFQTIMLAIGENYELVTTSLQAGGIVFSYDIHYFLHLNFTWETTHITQYLSSVRQDEVLREANLSFALTYIEQNMFLVKSGHRISGRKFIIYFVSDYADPRNFDFLKQLGHTIIAVGVNENLRDETVIEIASSASHAFFKDSVFSDTVQLLIKEFEYTTCTDRIKHSI